MPLSRIKAASITDGTIVAADIADNSISVAKLVSGTLPTAHSNSAFTAANTASETATAAGSYANSAFTTANSKVSTANTNTFTVSQRGTVTTDNDGSFDMDVTNNFKCTPSGTFEMVFTNITAGQSGHILLVNSGGHTITANSTTKVSATALATVSAAGTYLLSYFSDGTNVYVVNSGALA